MFLKKAQSNDLLGNQEEFFDLTRFHAFWSKGTQLLQANMQNPFFMYLLLVHTSEIF